MNKLFIEDLMNLIKDNPDIEIKCKVNENIAIDNGFSWWLGDINMDTPPKIEEYAIIDDYVAFKSENDYTYWFDKLFNPDDYKNIPDKDWNYFIKNKVDETINWKKAIFISIIKPN